MAVPEQRALELIRRQEQLAAERMPLEQHWQEIAELVNPMRADFTLGNGVFPRQAGEKRLQKQYDGTAALAAEQLAAGLWGMITNSANEWFSLQAQDPALNQEFTARRWLDDASRRMRDAFSAHGGRFYSRVMDLYADLVSFGTGIFYVEEAVGQNAVHYSCRPLMECFIAENDWGDIDTVIRKFSWTARQALQRWGRTCGEKIMKAAEKEPDRKFTFLHGVMPREDIDRQRFDAKGKNWASFYVNLEEKILLAEGGFHEFPYMVPRWSTRSRGVYGDSPAMLALPDVKMLNTMSKTMIVGAQKAVDPPLLATDENAVRGIRTSPGGIIYGGLDANGRRLYEPLLTGGNLNLGLEIEEQRRSAIREAFFHSLMLLVQQPNQTATEVLVRQEEKLRLMGPHLGRLQCEFLDPLINRQFNMMVRAGAFPPSPPVMQDLLKLRVEYVSPLARAQKSSEGTAILRAVEALSPLAQLDPTIMDNIDADAYARAILDAFGAPTRILRDPQSVEELRASRGQQQNMQSMLAAAKPMAGAMRDLSQAGLPVKEVADQLDMVMAEPPDQEMPMPVS